MIDAGRGGWLGRSGHFAERHALIVIIALGEVIVAIGLPVVVAFDAGERLPGRTAALLESGAFAGLLWCGRLSHAALRLRVLAVQLGGGVDGQS